MMKFNTRYGLMFSWGWLPPAGKTHAGPMEPVALAAKGLALFADHRFARAVGEVGGLVLLPTGM